MIRIAAVGDVHYGTQSRNTMRAQFAALGDRADLLFLAGDLTQSGSLEEVKALAKDLEEVPIPTVVVLGNHDYHSNQQREILSFLRESGIRALEGQSATIQVKGKSVGIVGLKGFGGGFNGACVTEFGEPEMKAFACHSRLQAETLRKGLADLVTDYKFVLLHFSPVEGTLLGERKEIYPFLGSYLLAEAIDSVENVDGVFHGHAHIGAEKATTPGGVPVRNVAQPVLRHAYKVYTFS